VNGELSNARSVIMSNSRAGERLGARHDFGKMSKRRAYQLLELRLGRHEGRHVRRGDGGRGFDER
jgi:hypothetical protein